MAASTYKAALDRVLVHEGGYSDHPQDPGGATMKGVTQRVYDLHRKAKGLPSRPVKGITKPELQEIYRTRYWDQIKGDQLPAGVDYVVFDGAVNSGVVQSVKWLQRALQPIYTGKVDGMMGPSTIAACTEYGDHDELVEAICNRRMAFLQALKTWRTFGRGWTARVNAVRATGQAWASGETAQPAHFVAAGAAKASASDAAHPPSKAIADASTGGGVVSAALAQATDQLTPITSIELVAQVVAFLTVAGVVVTIVGIGWRWYATRRAAELADALDR